MSKYIIEIPDDVQYVLLNGQTDNKCYTAVRPIAELEELNSDYINEHYGSLQDEAYQRGHDDGYEAGCATAFKPVSDAEYQRGLEEAWEAAQKVVCKTTMGDMSLDTLQEIFGVRSPAAIMQSNTAQQAIDKIKAYDDKHSDRIEVGDEVIDKDGDTTIVTNIHERLFDGLCSDGSTMSDLFLEDVRKTGRHYDHIGKLLEAIRA